MTAYEQISLFEETVPWASAQRRCGRRTRPTPSGRGRHETSLAAHEATRPQMVGRRMDIWRWLRANGPATDRDVRDGLYGAAADMNMVRPRITEMLGAGWLIEEGTTHDAATGMRVRRVRAVLGG